MTITEKYLEALRSCETWVTTGEWALKVAELYPDLLEKAEREAAAQQNDTTGLREITARIASNIARGAYQGQIEIDSSERPRKIRYITPEEVEEHEKAEIEEELETLTRAERIKKDLDTLTEYEKYRISEMETIAKTFNQYCKTDLEVDHAEAIMSDASIGKHHPDNLQLITKTHNRIKSKTSWKRMDIDKQVHYLKQLFLLQQIVFPLHDEIVTSLIERLKKVY